MEISYLRRLRDCTLLLSVLFVLASSAPATNVDIVDTFPSQETPRRELSDSWEEARKIWNGARAMQKQHARTRERRMVTDPTPSTLSINQTELLNLSVPTYVKELFWNISKHESNEPTVIRSIPATHTGNSCGFNFSIENISRQEILVRAELRIFMDVPYGSDFLPVYIQLYHGSSKSTRKRVTPSREGWVVLDVLNDIERWRTHHHNGRHIHFHVITYPTINDAIDETNGEDCTGSLKFYGARESSPNTDNRPVLMIYSNDRGSQIDTEALRLAAMEAEENKRKKRSDSEITAVSNGRPLGSCGRRTLTLNLTMFNTIWGIVQPQQQAVFPSTFNINVCGGTCSTSFPANTAGLHSYIAFYLHRFQHSTENYNARWTQCCAPVTYKTLEVLFALPGEVFKIVALTGISVQSCSCLSVLTSPT